MKIFIISILIVLLSDFHGQTANYDGLRTLYKEGKNKEAINLASSELKKTDTTDIHFYKILKVRVDCYMNESEFRSAIQDYRILTRLQPKNTDNYSGLAYAYWAIDDFENCLKSINSAYRINPNDPLTLSNMSYYHGQMGKIEECIEFSNKGLALKNLDSTLKSLLLNNRAFGYLSQNKFEKALIDTNESIKLNPANSFAYCYRGLAYLGMEQTDQACKDLETSRKLGGETLTKNLIEKHCMK